MLEEKKEREGGGGWHLAREEFESDGRMGGERRKRS